MVLLSKAASTIAASSSKTKILATTAAFTTMSAASSFYSLSATRSDGKDQSMDEFRGKVVYATNVASKWGATRREYALFEQLNQRWGTDKLVILAFPSREFGAQEFASDDDIQTFAASKKFPGILMKLGSVKGTTAPEVWQYMKSETGAADPTWNFSTKYLVSKTGKVSVPKGNVANAIEALMQDEE